MQRDEGPAQGMQLVERRLREALSSVEEAERSDALPDHLARLEARYREALAEYEAVSSPRPLEA